MELKCAGEACERETRVTSTQLVMIVLVLTVVMVVMHFLSFAVTGILAQVVRFIQFCVGLIIVAGMVLIWRVIARRARLSDIAIRVGKRAIRFGDPPVADKQLFNRVQGLLRTYRSTTQDMMESIAQLTIWAKVRQEEIGEAGAVLDVLRLEESSLRASVFALRDTKPEVVMRLMEILEEVLESKERRGRPREVLFLLLGAILGALFETLRETVFIK